MLPTLQYCPVPRSEDILCVYVKPLVFFRDMTRTIFVIYRFFIDVYTPFFFFTFYTYFFFYCCFSLLPLYSTSVCLP